MALDAAIMIRVADIQRVVAECRGLPPETMWQPSPKQRTSDNPFPISHGRQEAIFLASQLTRHSYSRLGHFFGGRDHSTVIYAVRKVGRLVLEDSTYAAEIEAIRSQMLGHFSFSLTKNRTVSDLNAGA